MKKTANADSAPVNVKPETPKVYNLTMTPEAWIAIPDHPFQRNTRQRLPRAVKGHLANYSPLHALVQMCVLPDGRQFKLDGHTRALAWEEKKITPPSHVIATVHPVQNMEEARMLYTHIDSAAAVEKTAERTYGAGRGIGLRNADANVFATNGRYGTPARLASSFRRGARHVLRTIDVYEAVEENKIQIEDLIDLGPQAQTFIVGISTAALMSHWRYGFNDVDPVARKVKAFWETYKRSAGTKIGQDSDGVQALTAYVMSRKSGKQREAATDAEICGIALACLEAYLADRTLKRTPEGLAVDTYFPMIKPQPELESESDKAA